MKHALLIEPEVQERRGLCRALAARGYLCDVAADAREAEVAIASQQSEGAPYALVLLPSEHFDGRLADALRATSAWTRTLDEPRSTVVLTWRPDRRPDCLRGLLRGGDLALRVPPRSGELERLLGEQKPVALLR